MMRASRPLSPGVHTLLDCERSIPSLSASERARAMIRARSALIAGMTSWSAPGMVRSTRWQRLAAITAAACLASAAVGAVAYEARLHRPSPSDASPIEHRPAAPAVVAPPPTSLPPLSATPKQSGPAENQAAPPSAVGFADWTPSSQGGSTTVTPADGDSPRVELRLLRQARAAVVREDYAAALSPIAEHTRRFKNGRLVEEREALRVKALVGLGRTDDARRAAATFQARFPRSALLRLVTQMADSAR